MADFVMPSLGADMEAGRLVEWHVKPGDTVARGDIIATVETDKAAIDVEVWEDGIVEALLVSEGTRVPVGTPLARIGGSAPAVVEETPFAAPSAPRAAAPPSIPPSEVRAPEPVQPPRSATADGRTRLRVTPLARVRAEELGVDLAGVRGSGPDGAITQADVDRAAGELDTPRAAPHAPTTVPPPQAVPEPRAQLDRGAAMRRAIAAAMTRSHREIPQYYLATAIDLSRALGWMEETNQQRPVGERLIPSALFIRAVALATREIPEMNGHWVDDSFHPAAAAHVGFAVAVPGGGLIAPAILDADRKPLGDVMTALRGLVARARAGSLRSSELGDGTITVTSLGDRGGIETVFGLINPPQVALVGFGSIGERPWAEHGLVGARRQVTVSLSGDHRVSDGHRGALFLAAIDRLLQGPERL